MAFLGPWLQKRAERTGRAALAQNAQLMQDLEEYRNRSPSVSCSYSDFYELYSAIRRIRPAYVLELGTGVSTVVIAHALKANGTGIVVSMEEKEEFYNYAVGLMPEHLKPYVEIHYSPAIEKSYGFFRGSAYKDIPRHPYEFVFVDGPAFLSDPNTDGACNYDFIDVVRNSDVPVEAIIDDRQSTCVVYGMLFPGKVRHDHIKRLGFVAPVSKRDLRKPKQIIESSAHTPWIKLTNYVRALL